jgi:hypothetical protein
MSSIKAYLSFIPKIRSSEFVSDAVKIARDMRHDGITDINNYTNVFIS